jgi:hypothetical protein
MLHGLIEMILADVGNDHLHPGFSANTAPGRTPRPDRRR